MESLQSYQALGLNITIENPLMRDELSLINVFCTEFGCLINYCYNLQAHVMRQQTKGSPGGQEPTIVPIQPRLDQ